MTSKLASYLAKLYQLCKYLISNYIAPYLKLAGINYNENKIMYINNNSGDIMERPIMIILKDKSFIEAFSNNDVAQIGYLYGKWLENNENA